MPFVICRARQYQLLCYVYWQIHFAFRAADYHVYVPREIYKYIKDINKKENSFITKTNEISFGTYASMIYAINAWCEFMKGAIDITRKPISMMIAIIPQYIKW